MLRPVCLEQEKVSSILYPVAALMLSKSGCSARLCMCVAQFRSTTNYVTGAFLGPRIGDKLVFSLLIFT